MFCSFLYTIALLFSSHADGYNYNVSPVEIKTPTDPVKAAEYQLMLEKRALQAEYTRGVYTYNINPYQANPYADLLSTIYLHEAIPLEQELTFESLLDTISSKQLKTIEAVVAELPSDMKNNFILMYNSRSLQDASPSSPRAIVFNPTTSLILTFNGGKKNQKGNSTIELIQFRHDQQRFEFRELTFDGKSTPHVSEANPAKCLECHQSPDRRGVDPRPNWEPYATWLGAFGANNGQFTGKDVYVPTIRESLKDRLQTQDTEALDQQETEYELFKNYVENIHFVHPRFSLLGKPNLHAPAEFTQQTNLLGLMRVARLIRENSPVAELYGDLLMAMGRCSDTIKAKFKDQSAALAWMLKQDFSRYYVVEPREKFKEPEAVLTVLLESIGVDTSDWSMDFMNGGRFSFRSRFGTPQGQFGNYNYAMINGLANGKALWARSCEDLATQGLKKINTAYETGELQKMKEQNKIPEPTGEQIAARCVKCHVDGMDPSAPPFPFDDPAKMAIELTKHYSARGSLFDEITYRTSDMALRKHQMPPSRRLSQKEHQILLNYLKEMK